MLLKGDDSWLNFFQGEVVNGFRCGIRKVGQMCAKVCEQLPRDDKTNIFIDHCQKGEKKCSETLLFDQSPLNMLICPFIH